MFIAKYRTVYVETNENLTNLSLQNKSKDKTNLLNSKLILTIFLYLKVYILNFSSTQFFRDQIGFVAVEKRRRKVSMELSEQDMNFFHYD